MTIEAQIMRHPENANVNANANANVDAVQHSTPAPANSIGTLLDSLLDYMNLRNDACLARELGIPPFSISKLRSGACAVDADMLIRMHEASGLPIGDLRAGMGDRRQRFHS